jgi:hypothetical protein
MMVVRKNLTVEKGEQRLFNDIRYFLYVTSDRDMTKAEVVFFADGRCNEENPAGFSHTDSHSRIQAHQELVLG